MWSAVNEQINWFFILAFLLSVIACKKNPVSPSPSVDSGGTYPEKTDSVYSPVDPSIAATIGFFGDAWKARTFTVPEVQDGQVASGNATDSLTIDVNKVLVKVPPYVFGANSNLWSKEMNKQPALVQYLTDLSPNIIRGPGGSISDVYFWNGTDANPAPSDAPANLLNAPGTSSTAGYWYGGNNAS